MLKILVEGGSSVGSYITKSINLANVLLLDIRVAASVRSESSIKFFRLSGGEETRRIEDIFYRFQFRWILMLQFLLSEGDFALDNDFKEHKFSASSLLEFTSSDKDCV